MSAIQAHYTGETTSARDILVVARDILERAREQTAVLEAEVRKRAAFLIRAGRRRARARGYANGLRCARLEWQNKMLEASKIHRQSLASASRDCFELCLQIAARILETEVGTNRRSLAQRIGTGLKKLQRDSAPRIYVAPGWRAEVEQALRNMESSRNFCVEEDQNVTPGYARLVYASGEALLDWREQFETLKQNLKDSLEKRLAESSRAS